MNVLFWFTLVEGQKKRSYFEFTMNKPNTHYGSDYTFKWIVVDGLYFKVSEDLDTNELVLG